MAAASQPAPVTKRKITMAAEAYQSTAGARIAIVIAAPAAANRRIAAFRIARASASTR